MGVGRPKNDMSQQAILRRKIAGERLRMLRKGEIKTPKTPDHLTQKKLSAILDRDVSVIRGYESGKGIPDEIAEKLELLTGIIKEYWTGSTAQKTQHGYQAECEENHTRAFALDRLDSQLFTTDIDRAAFFRVCGFSYQHAPSAAADFARAVNPPASETGLINPLDGWYHIDSLSPSPFDGVDFTSEEVNSLIEKVRNVIELECYKKQNKKRFAGLKRTENNK